MFDIFNVTERPWGKSFAEVRLNAGAEAGAPAGSPTDDSGFLPTDDSGNVPTQDG